ncbi:hypothetical protein JHW43_003927 [Diplocarpon mali]|nr:hypothetical protein JHW43_003927 [Diplocarpon mali]
MLTSGAPLSLSILVTSSFGAAEAFDSVSGHVSSLSTRICKHHSPAQLTIHLFNTSSAPEMATARPDVGANKPDDVPSMTKQPHSRAPSDLRQ